MIILAFFPKIWFEIMDPLVNEYKKVGLGTVKTELTLKAAELTRQFSIKLGTIVSGLFLAGLLF
jgi:hypothetical protein